MTEQVLAEAMSPVLSTLAADGYDGAYAVDGETLRLEISAGSGVCEDCLSPKAIMSRIVVNALASVGLEYAVELRYPTDTQDAES